MRRISARRAADAALRTLKPAPSSIPSCAPQPRRQLANIRDEDRGSSEQWFSGTMPSLRPGNTEGPGSGNDHKPPDERTLKLGDTIRTLHERLPTLFASPLPQEILSPQITLRLFPSTHPHLPVVTGKIGYRAALWTSPVAWGRMPFVGNVKLVILSERMVGHNGSRSTPSGNERLIVKWRTCGKTKGMGVGALYRGLSNSDTQVDKITEFLGGHSSDDDKEFSGLFIFEFDEQGRILSHTIEHAEEGGDWDAMPKVINVTDWLLGMARGKRNGNREGDVTGLALGYVEADEGQTGRVQERGTWRRSS
ncbi:hypothetical protein EJ06DRAFT_482276 [Trichodelitschia bisporula]|uniref:Uncharacterized protein n=1 Tax=Trichodelitschia bisporula TaxID=703511 RepID=A0A6G1HMB0_9PEZI|nr:hypothetical protein EJ06DRAFT_482276 [Trichodelitschia bisporula]